MKNALLVIAIILFVLACGCTSATPPAPAVTSQTTPAVPNLVGNWTGPARGYTEGIGFRDSGSATATMIVNEQENRVFRGMLLIPFKNGTVWTEGIAGVITPDGKGFRIVEFDSHEHDDGWILSENEIEMIFIDTDEPQSIMIDSLKRSP
ncbi:MAG: hypothetical protein WC586_06300 [Methanoregula sp.]